MQHLYDAVPPKRPRLNNMQKQAGFADLPNEILHLILKHLSADDPVSFWLSRAISKKFRDEVTWMIDRDDDLKSRILARNICTDDQQRVAELKAVENPLEADCNRLWQTMMRMISVRVEMPTRASLKQVMSIHSGRGDPTPSLARAGTKYYGWKSNGIHLYTGDRDSLERVERVFSFEGYEGLKREDLQTFRAIRIGNWNEEKFDLLFTTKNLAAGRIPVVGNIVGPMFIREFHGFQAKRIFALSGTGVVVVVTEKQMIFCSWRNEELLTEVTHENVDRIFDGEVTYVGRMLNILVIGTSKGKTFGYFLKGGKWQRFLDLHDWNFVCELGTDSPVRKAVTQILKRTTDLLVITPTTTTHFPLESIRPDSESE